MGDHAQLFIQGYDLNGGTAASLVVGSVKVQGTVVSGDFDGDGDVDSDDVGIFAGCKLGPSVTPLRPGCADADRDGDGDADQEDFGLLQLLLTGPRP